jgi:hypothetical protein
LGWDLEWEFSYWLLRQFSFFWGVVVFHEMEMARCKRLDRETPILSFYFLFFIYVPDETFIERLPCYFIFPHAPQFKPWKFSFTGRRPERAVRHGMRRDGNLSIIAPNNECDIRGHTVER